MQNLTKNSSARDHPWFNRIIVHHIAWHPVQETRRAMYVKNKTTKNSYPNINNWQG
jgi:hypothetical protein